MFANSPYLELNYHFGDESNHVFVGVSFARLFSLNLDSLNRYAKELVKKIQKYRSKISKFPNPRLPLTAPENFPNFKSFKNLL